MSHVCLRDMVTDQLSVLGDYRMPVCSLSWCCIEKGNLVPTMASEYVWTLLWEKGLVFSLVVSINLTWRKSFAVVLKQLQNKSTDNGHYSKFTVPMYPFLLNLSQHTEQHSAPLIHKKLKVGVGWGLYCLVCKSCVFKIRQNAESLFFSEVIWVEAVLELFLNSSYILQTQSYSQDIFSV